MHLSEGEIRAYLDHEDLAHRQRVTAHMESCPACQAQAEAVRNRARAVEAHFALLNPETQVSPQSAATARLRLEARRQEEGKKEYLSMLKRFFSRQARPAWALVAVVALLTVSLTIPSVRALANSFLSLFRVERISVISFDEGNLPSQLENNAQLEYILSNDFKQEQYGDPQDVASAAEASSLAGIPVRLPAEVDEAIRLKYMPGGRISFTLDVARAQAVLDAIGRPDIQLPKEADGSVISMEMSGQVAAQWGECEYKEGNYGPRRCTAFIQMQSPVVTAPPELDYVKLGEAFFQVLGMSAEEAANMANSINWTTTLVLPVPQNSASYTEIEVDGVQGVLIQERNNRATGYYTLIWVKDGIAYSLNGYGSGLRAVGIANSLR